MAHLPGFEPAQPTADEHDGAGDTWLTPRHIVEAVADAMDGIEVDPCSHPLAWSYRLALHPITLHSGGDGLRDPWPWRHRGGVYCNPPYSDVGPWLARCRAAADEGRPVVALVPTRPETRAWAQHVLGAGACIVQQTGRIRFVGADDKVHGNGMVTTCFVAWSLPLARRLRHELARRGVSAHVLVIDDGEPAPPRCMECGGPHECDHHIVPRSLGGKATVPLCEACHDRVHDKEGGGRLDSTAALTSAALQHKKARGERVGAVPYGQRLAADGVHLVPHEGEQKVIAAARELRACGFSLRRIAAELGSRGFKTRTGRVFGPKQISRMLAAAHVLVIDDDNNNGAR